MSVSNINTSYSESHFLALCIPTFQAIIRNGKPRNIIIETLSGIDTIGGIKIVTEHVQTHTQPYNDLVATAKNLGWQPVLIVNGDDQQAVTVLNGILTPEEYLFIIAADKEHITLQVNIVGGKVLFPENEPNVVVANTHPAVVQNTADNISLSWGRGIVKALDELLASPRANYNDICDTLNATAPNLAVLEDVAFLSKKEFNSMSVSSKHVHPHRLKNWTFIKEYALHHFPKIVRGTIFTWIFRTECDDAYIVTFTVHDGNPTGIGVKFTPSPIRKAIENAFADEENKADPVALFALEYEPPVFEYVNVQLVEFNSRDLTSICKQLSGLLPKPAAIIQSKMCNGSNLYCVAYAGGGEYYWLCCDLSEIDSKYNGVWMSFVAKERGNLEPQMFPDVNNASKNSPLFLMPERKTKALFEIADFNEIHAAALSAGWADVSQHGKQLLFNSGLGTIVGHI